jgi:hypothetical protein
MVELRKIHVKTPYGHGVMSIPQTRELFGMRQRDVLDCLSRGTVTIEEKGPYGPERITLTTSGK